ncbi:MAG TPA: hypothetical protein VKN18_26730 [Blastocatellia bacterium]|nr:hypothetical protein [Blastocatellia bacterium]
MPSDEQLFTRDEALGGLPARRAATLLFLIESRSAQLKARSLLAAEEFPTEKAAQELDLGFLEAFASSREPPLRPTIQDLERYAPQWAQLVPENTRLRAAIAHLLSEKYSFSAQAVPGMRLALGLDEPAVERAYQELYKRSLNTIFVPRISLIERLRWVPTAVAKRLDSLPPFWTTFVLVITLSLPQAVLALPIATAGLGPLAGVGLLVLFGFFNVLTMACMAEAFGRNGSIRYGGAFTGRVVSDYMGEAGSLLLVSATIMRLFIGLMACYYGLSVTMAGLTSIPSSLWAVFLFLLALYLLLGKSLNFSTALSALLGAVSIALVFFISLAVLDDIQWMNLSYFNVPLIGGRPFDRATLQVVFGIVIQSYLGHTYLTQCAKVVLPRDPGAASLLWGTVAASVGMTVLLCGWVLVVNGAVAPSVLSHQSGTVLMSLTKELGSHLNILGFLLAILLLGLGFVRQSTVLFNLVRELIPTRLPLMVVLPRRRASLLLGKPTPGNGPRLGLTYLGLSEGQPRVRLDVQVNGNSNHVEMKIGTNWDVSALIEEIPELRPYSISLALEIVDVAPESVRLRVTSTMNLKYEGDWGATGLHLADVQMLRDPLRELINWMTRQREVTLAEITAHTGGNEWIAQLMVEELIKMGFVQPLEGAGDPSYRIHLAARHGRQVPSEIWKSLDETNPAPPSSRPVQAKQGFHPAALWLRRSIFSDSGRFLISMSPVIATFVLIEWLILKGTSSFTGLLAVGGLLANSVVSGVFPVLLLVSSRRKGDLVPTVVINPLGHPLVVTGIYLLFLGILFLHGIVVWSSPGERAAALLVGLLVITVTIAMMRQGAFTRRVIVELKQDKSGGNKERAVFAITANGQPAVAEVEMSYAGREEKRCAARGEIPAFRDLRSITFHLPVTQARELKVWAHTVTADGASESLPVHVDVYCGNETKQFDLRLSGGQIVLPLTVGECSLRITLPEPEAFSEILGERAI